MGEKGIIVGMEREVIILKKVFKDIIVILLILSVITTALANSGPVYWNWYPSSDILTVDKNSPIEVENENLIFDFSKDEGINHSYECLITAQYEMINPTAADLSVQMAFPFIESLMAFYPNDIKITADNEELPYEIYLDATAKSTSFSQEENEDNYFDFEKIIGTITDDAYSSHNFTEETKGKLYSIHIEPTIDTEVNIAVDLTFNHERTKVFTTGFNSLNRVGEKTIISAWCWEPKTLGIYVLGEDIDFKIEGYTDGALNEKTNLYTYEISETEENVKTYLLEAIRKNSYNYYDNIYESIPDIQLYNIFAEVMDKQFTNNLGYCSDDEVLTYGGDNRIITLVYTVNFPPYSEKTVSVNYKALGTTDRRNTKEPVYKYDYILNPAKNWKDFKNLSVKIIPPPESPYIVESTIELNKEGNIYTASMESLPEQDFSFTLYNKEKITVLDSIERQISNVFSYSIIFIPFVIIIVIFIVIACIFSKKRK